MNDILSGTYKGNTYRIKVECYPNTPAIKVQLLPVNAGERITMTQNLGQPLPRYHLPTSRNLKSHCSSPYF